MFPFKVDPFSDKDLFTGKQMGSQQLPPFVKVAKNLLGISVPRKKLTLLRQYLFDRQDKTSEIDGLDTQDDSCIHYRCNIT